MASARGPAPGNFFGTITGGLANPPKAAPAQNDQSILNEILGVLGAGGGLPGDAGSGGGTTGSLDIAGGNLPAAPDTGSSFLSQLVAALGGGGAAGDPAASAAAAAANYNLQLGNNQFQENIANQQYGLQRAGVTASEAEANRQSGIQQRGIMESAAARGATTATGTGQSLNDLAASLSYQQAGFARQLQGIDLSQQGQGNTFQTNQQLIQSYINQLYAPYTSVARP